MFIRLNRSVAKVLFPSLALATTFMMMTGPALAASKNVDLNADGTAESIVSLSVLTSSPVKIQNKITNKASGQAFTFIWPSAGPGAFKSSLATGSSTGVGSIWTWQTTQQVYSFTGNACTNDLCFTRTIPAGAVTRGPFGVPGRSLSASGVTVSSASLTSSLITFFSPPTLLASVTSSVKPLGSGMFGYTTRIANPTTSPITVNLAAGPPGCCPVAHQLNCAGTCVDYLTDPDNCGACGNVCAGGEVCAAGSCVADCPAGQTLCSGSCVDLQRDAGNCGVCGYACGPDQICSNGACETCRPPTGTACSGQCVNIHTDAENCGACGVNCNFLCPSTGHGACSQGQSCHCTAGESLSMLVQGEAPVCEFPSTTQTVPAGTVLESCEPRVVLAKEIPSQLTVCGASIPDGPVTCQGGDPATEGPFNRLVPDLTKPVENVTLTLSHLELADSSGDRVPRPGEAATLKVSLLNVGPVTLTNASAVLSAPLLDLTDDGTANPVAIGISVASSTYPSIQGYPLTGVTDCSSLPPSPNPSTNAVPFSIMIPSNYPPDVAPLFNLNVSGQLAGTGQPFQTTVPIVIGIGGACNPSNPDNRFDGLNGLLSPMAPLVKAGDAVLFPPKALQQGKTFPMKLQILCGGVNLNATQIVPPQIVGLFRNGVAVDISRLALNADSPNTNDPYFRYPSSGSVWNFNTRTKDLAKGTYVIVIRIAGVEDYYGGFILN